MLEDWDSLSLTQTPTETVSRGGLIMRWCHQMFDGYPIVVVSRSPGDQNLHCQRVSDSFVLAIRFGREVFRRDPEVSREGLASLLSCYGRYLQQHLDSYYTISENIRAAAPTTPGSTFPSILSNDVGVKNHQWELDSEILGAFAEAYQLLPDKYVRRYTRALAKIAKSKPDVREGIPFLQRRVNILREIFPRSSTHLRRLILAIRDLAAWFDMADLEAESEACYEEAEALVKQGGVPANLWYDGRDSDSVDEGSQPINPDDTDADDADEEFDYMSPSEFYMKEQEEQGLTVPDDDDDDGAMDAYVQRLMNSKEKPYEKPGYMEDLEKHLSQGGTLSVSLFEYFPETIALANGTFLSSPDRYGCHFF